MPTEDDPIEGGGNDEYPRYRSHFLPRTRDGWIAVTFFCGLFALTQPPLLHAANRITPWVLGLPFLYGYLLVIYCALIAVLLWAQRRGV